MLFAISSNQPSSATNINLKTKLGATTRLIFGCSGQAAHLRFVITRGGSAANTEEFLAYLPPSSPTENLNCKHFRLKWLKARPEGRDATAGKQFLGTTSALCQCAFVAWNAYAW
jgi:hypothetical protein